MVSNGVSENSTGFQTSVVDDTRHGAYTEGWVCALPSKLAASRAKLEDEHTRLATPRIDKNSYNLGSIHGHNVVMACLPAARLGLESAALVASNMRATFTETRFGLMVGVGGGVPQEGYDIRLGDVVGSQPGQTSSGVVRYDFGRTVAEGPFISTGVLNSPSNLLLTSIATLRAQHRNFGHKISQYIQAMGEKYPKMMQDFADQGAEMMYYWIPIQYFTMERWQVEIKSRRHGLTRDKTPQHYGSVLCFEMEAAGLMNDFRCIVVRDVCDYADSHKMTDGKMMFQLR